MVTIRKIQGVSGSQVLQVSGPLTQATSIEFLAAAGHDRAEGVILDLSGVDHMDSAGVGSVVIFAACQTTPLRFRIVAPDWVRGLFKIAGVDGLLLCFTSLEDAARLKVEGVAA